MMSPELEYYLRRNWYGIDSARDVTKFGLSALHGAITECVELVQELMCEMGDLIHHQDYFGCTALHYVCRHDDCDMVALLASRISQTIQNQIKRTALHEACLENPSNAPLLKWHEIPDEMGYTPMDLIRKYHPSSHPHVLAKLRRLLGTLPTAYIRLVHKIA